MIFMADGQGVAIKESISYIELRGLCFENTAAPAGITKAPGNPPAWIEFSEAVTVNGVRLSIKQANIVSVMP